MKKTMTKFRQQIIFRLGKDEPIPISPLEKTVVFDNNGERLMWFEGSTPVKLNDNIIYEEPGTGRSTTHMNYCLKPIPDKPQKADGKEFGSHSYCSVCGSLDCHCDQKIAE